MRLTPGELAYVANADEQLDALAEGLWMSVNTASPESLTAWLSRFLDERRLSVGTIADWPAFVMRAPALSRAGPRLLQSRGIPLPSGVPQLASDFLSMAQQK